MKSEQHDQILFGLGWFVVINDCILFIDPDNNLKMMNIETKVQLDLHITDSSSINCFENNVLIQGEENELYF